MKNDILSKDECPRYSRRMQGKRGLAVFDTCKIELRDTLESLFVIFQEASYKTNEVLSAFPPQSRSRGLEAIILQSCFADCLFKDFKENAFFGKYKRLILRKEGYIILFKKLNSKGYPMNIKTGNIQSILDQNQVLDLFAESDYNDEPILYFGYQKDIMGQYSNPELVYIDDGKIRFTMNQNDIGLRIGMENTGESKPISKAAIPRLKATRKEKKRNA